jgi:hypothetical protein
VFQWVTGKVHFRQIPDQVRTFIDDVGLKGPKSQYGDEEISPGIRRFVWEFLSDVWKWGMTISGLQSAIGMPGINIVGMCDVRGWYPELKKVIKIVNLPVPVQQRMFAHLLVFVCIIGYCFVFDHCGADI